MVPRIVQFESEGASKNVTNQAWVLCNSFDSVTLLDTVFAPRLLVVIPEKEEAELPKVFDPPPWAA